MSTITTTQGPVLATKVASTGPEDETARRRRQQIESLARYRRTGASDEELLARIDRAQQHAGETGYEQAIFA